MTKCLQCGFKLTEYSSKYYCCDQKEIFCSWCASKKCLKCRNTRSSILKPPQCFQCRLRVNQETSFKDKNCGKYYCSRCLVKSFNPVYLQLMNQEQFSINEQKKLVRLFCGHQCKYSELKDYFKNYCIDCGQQYRKTSYYQLKDGLKLCLYCNSFNKSKYQNSFISCLSCGKQINSLTKADFIDNQGLILCQQCINFSNFSQIQLEQSRVLQESRKIEQQKYKQKKFMKSQQHSNKNLMQNQNNVKIEQKNQNEIPQIIINQPKLEQQKTIAKNKEKTKQKEELFKPTQAKKQNYLKSPRKQHYPVVNKIIDEVQEGNEEMRKSLGLQKKPLLKKYLSDETRVEHLQLQIQPNKLQQYVPCKQCNVKISPKVAYSLSSESSSYIKRSSLFVSIKSYEESNFKKDNKEFVCRVCYQKLQNLKKKENDYLSPLHKKQQEYDRLSQSRRTNKEQRLTDYCNRMNRSIYNQSPYKDYGFSGVKEDEIRMSQMNPTSKYEKSYAERLNSLRKASQMTRASSNYLSNQRVQNHQPLKKCFLCRSSNKKLTLSATKNYYCIDCLPIHRHTIETRGTKLIF